MATLEPEDIAELIREIKTLREKLDAAIAVLKALKALAVTLNFDEGELDFIIGKLEHD